jgi:carbon storage regulator
VLIVTRRVQERLMIGNDVVVTILGVKGNHVRIGIEAPPHISVDREEVYWRKRDGEEPQTEAERV